MTAARQLTASEEQCEDAIIDAARILGYRVHAERRARSTKGWRTPIKGDPGWPDLVIVGHGHAFFIELKRRGNKPTADQTAWHRALEAAGLCAGVFVVPEEQQLLITWLTRLADRGAT